MPSRAVCSYCQIILSFLLVLVSGAVSSQEVNPLEGDYSAVRAGSSLFRAQCATCHGADATGITAIDAPDLTQMWGRDGVNDASVFRIIRDGISGTIMPPHSFTESELWMLVAYLRSIGSGNTELPAGDEANGRDLFATNCVRCHRAGGEGGSLGPSLQGITRQRSLDSLIASVRNPSANIRRGYKPVSLVTQNGERVMGILKSEDAFSLQIMDMEQRLRAFPRQSLQALSWPESSLMPAFDSASLDAQELMDVFNFLHATE